MNVFIFGGAGKGKKGRVSKKERERLRDSRMERETDRQRERERERLEERRKWDERRWRLKCGGPIVRQKCIEKKTWALIGAWK